MAGEAAAGIGTAAGEFMKGFFNARLQGAQQAMEQHQQKIQDMKMLADSIDKFQGDPTLQATLLGHLNEGIAGLPKPPKVQDQQGSSVVNFFKNMFGGKKKGDVTGPADAIPPRAGDQGGASGGDSNAIPERLPSPPLPPMSPGSQTFGGDLSHMTPPAPAAPAAPAATPAAPTGLGPMAQPSTPATPATPLSNEFLPRPEQLAQEAINKTVTHIPGGSTTPGAGVRNPQLEQRYVQAVAGAHADTALQAVEGMLAQHPEVKTLRQAYSTLGPDFAHVMDSVQQYENAGMIPKGRLESWQKRFHDVLFGSEKYNERDVKDGKKLNPETGEFDTPVSDEAILTAAYSTPKEKRTPEQVSRIAGHIESLEDKAKKDPNSLNADEQVRMGYYQSLKDKGLTGKALMDEYQAHAHPPQPMFSTTPGIDPVTKQSFIYTKNERTGAMEKTPIRTPGGEFIPSRYQEKIPGPPVKGPTGKDLPGPPIDGYSASRLIGAHSAHDPAVSLETLIDLLNHGADMTPEDHKKLSDYVNSQTAPKF
jgi:hypothetical protein